MNISSIQSTLSTKILKSKVLKRGANLLRPATYMLPFLLTFQGAAQSNTIAEDKYISERNVVSTKGSAILSENEAPSPHIVVNNKKVIAAIVVDVSNNILYRYDKDGTPLMAYCVATGAENTSTHTGLKKIIAIESYPYKYAVRGTKRRRNPSAYGTKALILTDIDPKTGADIGSNGEFIHGTNNLNSLGKKASHGCIRMDNEVIKEIAAKVNRGDYVIIQ